MNWTPLVIESTRRAKRRRLVQNPRLVDAQPDGWEMDPRTAEVPEVLVGRPPLARRFTRLVDPLGE